MYMSTPAHSIEFREVVADLPSMKAWLGHF